MFDLVTNLIDISINKINNSPCKTHLSKRQWKKERRTEQNKNIQTKKEYQDAWHQVP